MIIVESPPFMTFPSWYSESTEVGRPLHPRGLRGDLRGRGAAVSRRSHALWLGDTQVGEQVLSTIDNLRPLNFDGFWGFGGFRGDQLFCDY